MLCFETSYFFIQFFDFLYRTVFIFKSFFLLLFSSIIIFFSVSFREALYCFPFSSFHFSFIFISTFSYLDFPRAVFFSFVQVFPFLLSTGDSFLPTPNILTCGLPVELYEISSSLEIMFGNRSFSAIHGCLFRFCEPPVKVVSLKDVPGSPLHCFQFSFLTRRVLSPTPSSTYKKDS